MGLDSDIDPIWRKHADEIRELWQARAIMATRYEPLGMVVLSVLAHNFDEAMPILMGVVFPGFRSITTPFLASAGKINKRGQIIADVVWDDWTPVTKGEVIFRDTRHLERAFRKLADTLKLDDADRVALIAAAKKWVVADQRLDPTMDPADPDARRLTLN